MDKCHDRIQDIERQIGEQKRLKTKSDNDTKRLRNKKEKYAEEVIAEQRKVNQILGGAKSYINSKISNFNFLQKVLKYYLL